MSKANTPQSNMRSSRMIYTSENGYLQQQQSTRSHKGNFHKSSSHHNSNTREIETSSYPSEFSEQTRDKNNLYDNDHQEQYPISSIRKLRDKIGAFVNNEYVQTTIVFLIAVNSILMGIGTFDFVTEDAALNSAFHLTDRVFLIIFTVELGMQLIYHGPALFLDGWLVFDFFIVIFSWVFNSMQGIRAFRIFRALRLVTRFKTMRNLVTALLNVVPRILAIAALLMLIFYIFAVMFTNLFMGLNQEDYPDEVCATYFTSLDWTFFALFQMMTLEWAYIARSCTNIYWWAWLPFFCFVALSAFIVFNLIIAVICDAVAVLHESENDENEHDIKTDLHLRVKELSRQAKLLTENQIRNQNALEELAISAHYVQASLDGTTISVSSDATF